MLKRTLIFLLLSVGVSFAQGSQRISQATQNAKGYVKVLPGALVSVCTYPDCNAAVIYEDPALAIPIAQPLHADTNGNYNYYVAPGQYYENVSSPGVTTTTNVISFASLASSPLTNKAAVFGAGVFSIQTDNNITSDLLGDLTALSFLGPLTGPVGATVPNTGTFTSLTSTGTTTIPAPILSNVTGGTQCLHVDPSGQVSGFGSDCGSGGGGGGNVTGTALTNNAVSLGATGSAIKVDNALTSNGSGTLTAVLFSGPLTGAVNGTVGATTPNTGRFTTLQSTGATTVPAPVFSNLTGLTQCLHVNSSGQVTGTGVDCGSGSGGGNVTGTSLTNNAAVFGSTGSAIKVDNNITATGLGGLNIVNHLLVGNTDPAGAIISTLTSTQTSGTGITMGHNSTAFTGTGLLMNYAAGSGSFTGNFLDLQKNSVSQFKVTNAGAVTAAGTATLNNLYVPGTATPSLQGAYIGWNRTAGGGETDFFNNQGGGGGGFNWYNTPNAGTPVSLIASMTGAGALTTTGLTSTGLTTTAGLTSTANMAVTGSFPEFMYYDASAPVDEKRWDMYVDNTAGTLVGRTLNDAFSLGHGWMEVTRSGFVPTSFLLFEPTISNSSFTATSYNLVLQADQYCTTPGVLDGTCLTNAMAACPSSGCSIQMPEGTIIATTGQLPITVTKPIQFIGRSWEDSIITTSDTTKDIFYIPSTGDVIFRDFQITRTGTPSAGAGIEIVVGQHIVIDHMLISGHYNNINISGNAFWDKIDNSIFSGAKNDGIASQCQGLMMTDNVIIYNAGNGLEVTGQGSCGECKGNSYYANKGFGIWYHLSSPTQTAHVGDGVDSSGNVGVMVQGVNGFTFANGFVYSSGTGFSGITPINTFINVPGLVVDNTDTQTIIINGNAISNNGGDGIQCSGCPQAVISNNLTFINNQANAGGAGIHILNSGVAWGNITVTGNNAPDVRSGNGGFRQAYGLAISGGAGGTISGSGNSWAGALGAFNAGTISASQSWAGNFPTNLDNNIILSGAPSGACRSGTIYTRSDATGGLYVCVNTAWSQVTIP